MPELAQQLTEACGPGMPGPYRGVKGKQSATGENPSGAAAPPPFDKGGREWRGQDPSLRMEDSMAADAKRAGRACPAPTGWLKESSRQQAGIPPALRRHLPLTREAGSGGVKTPPYEWKINGSRRKVCRPGMPGPYRVVKESGNGRGHRSDAVELSPDRQRCSGLR